MSVRIGLCRWSSPPAAAHRLLDAAATSTRNLLVLTDAVRDLRDHLDLPGEVDKRPLKRVMPGALWPWLDPLLLSGSLRTPESVVPTPLLPVLGAGDIRGAAAAITGGRPSRLVIRSLGQLTVSSSELPLASLSAALLAGRLQSAHEQVAAVLDAGAVARRLTVEGVEARPLRAAHLRTAVHLLDGGDRRLTTELLLDAISTTYNWDTFCHVLDVVGAHGAWRVPPLAALDRWVRRVTDGFVQRHGDVMIEGPRAHPLHGEDLGDGLRIVLLDTVREVTLAGREFDNCLQDGLLLPDVSRQYLVVRDGEGRGIAIGHLRARAGRVRLETLLGPANEPIDDHLHDAVRAAVRRVCGET